MAHIVVITVLVSDEVQSYEKTLEFSKVALEGIRQEKCVLEANCTIEKIRPKIELDLLSGKRGRRTMKTLGLGKS